MKKSIIVITLVLLMSLCLAGCGQSASAPNETVLLNGGVLVLSVNPEIAVEYDENGLVTGVTARNDDALAIISKCEDLIGKKTREAVTDLVAVIGEAGYFLEEVEGEQRKITLEIEAGSKLPYDEFLEDIFSDVYNFVNANDWHTPVDLKDAKGIIIFEFDDDDVDDDDKDDIDDIDDDGDDDFDDIDDNDDDLDDIDDDDYDDYDDDDDVYDDIDDDDGDDD